MNELPDQIISRKTDDRGRANLGSEYGNKVVKLAVVDSKPQVESGDVISFEGHEGQQYALVSDVERDGEILLKYDRRTLHPHEDEYSLVERTGNPEMDKDELVAVIEEHGHY